MLNVNSLTGPSVWGSTPGPSAELIGAYLLLVVALILGGVAVTWAVRHYRRPPDVKLTPEEQLDRFRALEEQGELSPEEFERIRTLLGQVPAARPQSPGPQDRPDSPDAFKSGNPRP